MTGRSLGRAIRAALSVLLVLLVPAIATAGTVLENPLWRVDIDPATLALDVQPAREPIVRVSQGAGRHGVTALIREETRARWQWDEGKYEIEIELKDSDLFLSIGARSAGELALVRQPAAAIGEGLILPLAEGHYVPTGDRRWRDFLLGEFHTFDTSQGISLPLWGLDHGTFTLSWLLTNPFNNTVTLTRDGEGVALSLSHRYASLAPQVPMTLVLHLGGADPLAGAKRYREWLVSEGAYESLASKIARTPQADKLIGAAHAYLWGSGLLSVADVADWPAFIARLRSGNALASRLRGHFDSEARRILDTAKPPFDRYRKKVLIEAFNGALNAIARRTWQTEAPDMSVLESRYGELRGEVAQVFAQTLVPEPARWGGGVSVSTMQRLRAAGLPRLWIGLGDGWEGGLWHPEAIAAGVEAGYLVAPYDSYETALKTGDNPDWTTAHLGARAYRECAIVLENGTFKAGFQQSGHYTEPNCVRPLMQVRVQAVLATAPFNSWFLDAYATGMVFDSYRPGSPTTQAHGAAGAVESSRWLSETLGLPAGSEDGNATTARGIAFAHGMQTPVIGWGDTDMQRNKASPYHVGSWYPGAEPAVFFKPVPVKEPYKTIHFNPATRLPLYQAVFHGSVITTHHWLFDSLKLTNVSVENELAQLLYNVPPLYHLSGGTLDDRLPVIERQDAFFRPLHRKLATQAMTGLRWRSGDRLLQETAFADGTRLIANFSNEDRSLEGRLLPARSVTALGADATASTYVVTVPEAAGPPRTPGAATTTSHRREDG